MNQNLISVIIPTYNYASFVKDAIQSALNQTYPLVEILVIDDGSTDGTQDLVKEFQGEIVYLRTPNRGACAARNLGMLVASGSYFAFLDSDDVWLPEKLEKQMEALIKLNADLVYCDMYVTDEKANKSLAIDNPNQVDLEWFHDNPGRTPFAPSTVLVSREVLSLTSSWNTFLKSPAEDFDLFRRCSKYASFSKVHEPLVIHRNHGRSLTSKSFLSYMEDNVRACKLMILEDGSVLSLKKRLSIWPKLYAQFVKHAIKRRDFNGLLSILKLPFLTLN